jgi:L-Lysine epsilon oxidase N-terminal/L-lysine epsilon oxidase C-terminal domain
MSDLDRITSCAIHPALGVARIGRSPSDFYLAPEVPGSDANPGSFKDANGHTKREGARFRVYGYAADRSVVKELTLADGDILWRVHVANRKAAWYNFENALDLGVHAKSANRRNADVADRRSLLLDPGPRSIAGQNKTASIDTVAFGGTTWHLGDLRTDGDGRLIVLGGHGVSRSRTNSPPQTFANNDDWIDDTSDGPVRATVKLKNGRTLEAEPSMVAVAPPNFGQGLRGVVTMYDVAVDLFVRRFGWKIPDEVWFWRDIFPIFDRLCGLSGVNAGAFVLFGPGSPANFVDQPLLEKLRDNSAAAMPLRTKVFRWFRNPGSTVRDAPGFPPVYGDLFGDFENQAAEFLSLTSQQYDRLERWSRGDFVVDHAPTTPPSSRLEDLPLGDQPHAVDRASLENCLGGPFHPGIELTWTLRLASMWREPFRLNILPENVQPHLDLGPVLTPEIALADDGPFAASGPGMLTCFLGVPWQTDEASCDAGYEFGTFLPLPTYWAARVPNHVMPERAYERFLDVNLPVSQRFKHLNHRSAWLRFFSTQYLSRIRTMVTEWDDLGIVVARKAPPDGATFGLGDTLYVETEVDGALKIKDPTFVQVLRVEGEPDPEELDLLTAGLTPAAAPPAPRRRVFHRGEV